MINILIVVLLRSYFFISNTQSEPKSELVICSENISDEKGDAEVHVNIDEYNYDGLFQDGSKSKCGNKRIVYLAYGAHKLKVRDGVYGAILEKEFIVNSARHELYIARWKQYSKVKFTHYVSGQIVKNGTGDCDRQSESVCVNSLMLINESDYYDPVDMAVLIDGALLIHEYLYYCTNASFCGHNYTHHPINIKMGKHRLEVRANKGKSVRIESLDIEDGKQEIVIKFKVNASGDSGNDIDIKVHTAPFVIV